MKKKRQSEILLIIKEEIIENQTMLIRALSKRGYDVTQATVSRDINELRIEKRTDAEGISRYFKSADEKNFDGIFNQSIISVDCAMNIVCLKCRPGLASAACVIFDTVKPEGVVGTIAGDDTVFILMRSEDETVKLCKKLKMAFKNQRTNT